MTEEQREPHGGLAEILRRWRKYLIILLPTVVVACIFGLILKRWWIPALTIPVLLAPLVVGLLFRNVKPVAGAAAAHPWRLIYQGPVENSRFIREALAREDIASWDPSDHEMGGRGGSGGHGECAIHVDKARVEAADKILRRLKEERPDPFQEPPAKV